MITSSDVSIRPANIKSIKLNLIGQKPDSDGETDGDRSRGIGDSSDVRGWDCVCVCFLTLQRRWWVMSLCMRSGSSGSLGCGLSPAGAQKQSLYFSQKAVFVLRMISTMISLNFWHFTNQVSFETTDYQQEIHILFWERSINIRF